MLQSIKKLYGDKLGAWDGEIGHVKDFYFDDQNWAVRYVVADTGSWLSGRQVLLSPHSLGHLTQADKVLHVKLTRKQIEGSPSFTSHKPVSRQEEEQYYNYYGLPCYWQGDGLWGMSGFPILPLPPHPISNKPGKVSHSKSEKADAHLRSTQAVTGYHVQATDGIAGQVCDFLLDSKTWGIDQLVVKIGHRFSGKEVLIAPANVDRISYDDSTIFVTLTREAVEQGPQQEPAASAART